MRITALAIAAACAAIAAGSTFAADPAPDDRSAARGKYLAQVGACNDCHTANYIETNGNVPEGDWLTGSAMGWQGAWGTTYPANLRLTMARLTEAQWMAQARSPRRPPMPWFNLRDMSDDDLQAIYRYVTSLGPKGEPAPAYVPPGAVPKTPYIVFEPQNPPGTVASTRAGH